MTASQTTQADGDALHRPRQAAESRSDTPDAGPGTGPLARRASPLARTLLAVCTLLILAASTAPWNDWRDLGISPFAYLLAPLPQYITQFDLLINVLGYLPFGALMVLALYPAMRGAVAWCIAVVSGALVSGLAEAIQTWLPERVASNLDLATNVLGSALGAALMVPWTAALIDRGRLALWRRRWFLRDATGGLVLVGAWPLLQSDPTPMLFGLGSMPGWSTALLTVFSSSRDTILAPLSDERLVGAMQLLPPSTFVIAEAVVVAVGVLAAGLTLASLMRPQAPRVALLVGLLLAAVGVRALSYGSHVGADRAFMWLTPGAWIGLAGGTIGVVVLSAAPRRLRLLMALLAGVVLVGVVNGVPANPYHVAWRQTWSAGRLAHLSAIVQLMAASWPLLLLSWGIVRLGRRDVPH